MKTSKLVLLALLPVCVAFAKVPEHVENPAFDAKKVPVMDEAKPSYQNAIAAWKPQNDIKPVACEKHELWRVNAKSLIQAMAFKEKTVGVPGKFTRFDAIAKLDGISLRGAGALDLSSWDSGVPARDYRVQKYVFAVEEKGKAILPFQFHVENFNPKETDWLSPVDLEFKFHGVPVKLRFPAKLHREGQSVTIASAESKRFTFLSDRAVGPFKKMMELCNHHFLASYADVKLELTLDNLCKK